MPKKESEKLWQRCHQEKVKEYNSKYRKNKTALSVVLDNWVIEVIDEVKDPSKTYGAWVRELVESWASSRKLE